MPRFAYRITKYDPADRDEYGSYIGAENPTSDHGPVESAYVEAVVAFAAASGVDHLVIRDPQAAPGFTHFGLEPALEGGGLAGLFPPDLRGFHDGAVVSLPVALELVRVMLRDGGAWCCLEVDDTFAVHVGWDQYLYVSSDQPCEHAIARIHALGLFPERLRASPYAHVDEPGVQRPADEDFWARLRWSVSQGQAVILEEVYVDNASRRHRLTVDTLDTVRSALTPRAKLYVWPALSSDVGAVLAALPDEGLVEFVWEDANGAITSVTADESEYGVMAARLAGVRSAAVLPLSLDAPPPLFTAVLPDSDGVLRARWRTEPSPSDHDWALLTTLRPGQSVAGTVTEIDASGVAYVDIGGFIAVLAMPEPARRPTDRPSDALTVGERISAGVLAVDMVRERVSLSLRAPA
ncbi:S1 RNA-binding domain-containing protein [Streptomyces sp. NPDC006482]|uniref:S1 RNA-binding domain-containing protein n=1 Tax=Streptomyces sp. NPDC006482 TaxID=3154306 RepID=UPI00339DAB48